MANKNQKWSQELRMVLYSRLVCEFGPYSGWGKVAYPAGRRERFEEVLKELAAYFSSHTGKSFEWTALEQQFKWGVTRQGRVKNSGFAYQYILNKAAALETGFLSSAELRGFEHLTAQEADVHDNETDEEAGPGDDLIPSDEIGDRRPPELPDSDAFHVIVEFGHEFDGYEKFGGFERLADMAQGLERQFRETGRWEGTIDELRGTLFFMLRRDRHTDMVPTVTLPDGTEYTPGGEEDEEDIDMLRSLYNSIRGRWDEVSFC